MATKRCTRCRCVLDVALFVKNRSRADGLTDHCANCRRVSQRATLDRRKAKGLVYISPSRRPVALDLSWNR